MKKQYLILGATGSIGYGFTQVLLEAGENVTILVRDTGAAARLFGQPGNLSIAEGDALDDRLLNQLAEGKDFIFHGISVPYDKWQAFMPDVTQKVIEAAKHARAVLLFPGNNYNFGKVQMPITELTPYNPSSRMGAVRVALEQMLQTAARQNQVKVIVLRMAEVWGPNVTNKGVAPIFENVLRGKPMPWLVRSDIPQQWVFNLDAGRALYELSKRIPETNYTVYNYGGVTVPSIQSWFGQIARQAGQPFRQQVMPGWVITVLAWFVPFFRELNGLLYKYQQSILLDDQKFRAAFPGFENTPMADAIDMTLAWFKNRSAQSLDPATAKSREKAVGQAS